MGEPAAAWPLRAEELGAFIGRSRERAAIVELLDAHRLVTLVGPGGSGKTRLALQVMRDVEARYAAGVAFVDLAGLTEAAAVPDALVAALGIRAGPRAAQTALLSFLAAPGRLLVLDNLEQIDGIGRPLRKMLAAAPGLTMLGTSRTPLHVRGERLFLVGPFPVPDPRWSSLDDLAAVDSVAFLVDRTTAVTPGFELTESNAGAIVALCRRLDGLPLALELVAPQVRAFGPTEVAARLDHGLSLLLASSDPDSPPRQRTVGATIAWSESLLGTDARTLLAELSVFVAPFELDAALGVASGGEAALPALAGLVDANLVLPLDPDLEPRAYRMLQTVRAFGLERLETVGRVEVTRDRYAAWLTDFGRRANAGLAGDQAAWLRRLNLAREDLEASLDWLIERRDAALAQRLAVSLFRYWELTGRLRHRAARLAAVLQLDPGSQSADRLEALLAATRATDGVDDPSAFQPVADEAADLASRLGGRRAVCLAEQGLAVADLRRGHAAAAVERLEPVLPLARELGDAGLLMSVLTTFGTSAEMVGDTRGSDEARSEVEDIARATGDTEKLGGSIADRGFFVGQHRGSRAAGAELLREGIEILRPLGMTASLTWSLLQLSMLESRLGAAREARSHLLEALPPALEEEDALKLTNILGALFWLALAEGRAAEAEALWPTLLTALSKYGISWQRPGFLVDLARSLTSAVGHGTVRRRLAVAAVPAEPADLIAAIRTAQRWLDLPPELGRPSRPRGRYELTDRELDVLRLLVEGASDAAIASRLGMSRKTASVHVSNIKGKLGVDSRTAAALEAVRLRLA